MFSFPLFTYILETESSANRYAKLFVMYELMRQKIAKGKIMRNIKIRWATLTAFFSLVIMLIAIQPASAANQPSSSSLSIRTTSIAMSSGNCALLKAHFPQKASDPNLCSVYHKESIVGQPNTMAVAANGCPSGTLSFSDNYWDAGLANWSLILNTSWRWNGNCKAPDITSEHHYVNYTLFPVTGVNDQNYYTYYTSLPSQAAVYQGFIQFIGFGYNVWQRRECYGNKTCNWHTDNG